MNCKKLLVIMALGIISGVLSSVKALDLNYSLSFKGTENRIGVVLEFQPNNYDEVGFSYGEPMFGGQADIVDCIQDIKVTGVASWHFDRSTRQLAVKPAVGLPAVHISYNVIGRPTEEDDFKKDLFRPVITVDGIYCHGLNLFLMPAGGDFHQCISWDVLPPFPLTYMWDPKSIADEPNCTSPSQVYMSLIVGSDDIEVTPVAFQQMEGFVITSLPEEDKDQNILISKFFEKSMSGLRNFWTAAEEKDSYVFAMLPFSGNITHSVGGIGLTGGFCSKYSKDPESDGLLSFAVRHNLTHEMGHKWLGGPFSLGLDNQWFHEGFNDYLTYYVNFENGIVSSDELQDYWNRLIDSYYGSEVHNLPNEEVLANYWKIGDYNKLPYWRGAIFACYIDSLIRRASDGHKDWRNFMLLLKGRLEDNHSIGLTDFTEILQTLLPNGISATTLVQKHMIDGEDISKTEVSVPPFITKS